MAENGNLPETITELKKAMKDLSYEMDQADINAKDPYQRSRGITFEISQLFLKFRKESAQYYKRNK